MANSEQIREILQASDRRLTEAQINIVTERTAATSIFDIDAVVADLGGYTKPNAYDVANAINKHSREQVKQYCGKCQDTWIPLLDWHLWKELGEPTYKHTVFMHKRSYPCPVCQKSERTQKALDDMTETQRGWCYVILYDFYANALFAPDPIGKDEHGKPLYPPPPTIESFDPAKLWGLHLNPLLTPEQMAVMQWVNAKHVIPEPHAKMRPRINPMAAAEQFIAVGEKVVRK